MFNHTKPKAIIFDVDDTLVATFKCRAQAHIFTAKKFYNLDLSREDIIQVWGQPYEQMISSLYRNVDQVENIITNYESLVSNYPIPAYQGAVETISKLVRSYTLGVLTAAPKHLVNEIFQFNHFNPNYFIHIQTAEDTSVHKPDPQVFQPILASLEHHHIKPHQTLYVGDALRDYYAARDAGLQFVGVTTGLNSASDFAAHGAIYISSLPKLIKLLS